MWVQLLGRVRVFGDDGTELEVGGPKQQTVLALLYSDPGVPVSIGTLTEALWGDDPPDRANRSLSTYVSNLRRVLGGTLARHGSGYVAQIDRDWVDACVFDRQVALARRLIEGDPIAALEVVEEALELWQAEPFGGLDGHLVLAPTISRLSDRRLEAVEIALEAKIVTGLHSEAIPEVQAEVREHPGHERLRGLLMRALYAAGRQTDALAVYREFREHLAEEFGLDPSPELQELELQILQQDPTLRPTANHTRGPPLPAPTTTSEWSPAGLSHGAVSHRPSSELPPQRTSFVGRERELAQGAELLERSRLLTLTGPPGSGKTRLALQLAADHMNRFPHGTFFVSLAAITNSRLMEHTIARVLGLREVREETALDGIRAFFRDRNALLILDNFEQILAAAPQVGEILNGAPDLTIMVTSRAPLRISGEQEFPVPPLNIPPPDRSPDLEALAAYDAVALFVARARAADPDFQLSMENASPVARITARVDGLPLAIELAAARVKLLTPQDLLSRLERRLNLLTAAPADTSDRHRAMRDAIAFSYDLLEREEQALFRRLGVFGGGFTPGAAAAVADLPDVEIINGVDALLTWSLLYRAVGVGQARFAMLEMIREFALEQLASAGEKQEAAARHAGYFCRLAESIEPQLTHEPGGIGSQRLASEVDNFRGALRYALDADDPDIGLSLASCLWRFWQSSDQLTEGKEWLEGLLALPEASPAARAAGLTAFAGLAYWQAEYDEAWATYEEALELYRAIGDRFGEADTLYSLSMTASWNRDPDTGERLAEQARLLFEELGFKEGIGKALLAKGFSVFKSNRFSAALELYEEALVIARESGNPALAATVLVGVGALTFHLGDRDKALKIMLDTVEETTQLRNDHITVWALDLVAAFSALAAPEAAARLGGAVDSLRQSAGGGMLPESLGVADARSVARQLLSPGVLEQAWALGRAMSLDDAVSLAHQVEGLLAGDTDPSSAP